MSFCSNGNPHFWPAEALVSAIQPARGLWPSAVRVSSVQPALGVWPAEVLVPSVRPSEATSSSGKPADVCMPPAAAGVHIKAESRFPAREMGSQSGRSSLSSLAVVTEDAPVGWSPYRVFRNGKRAEPEPRASVGPWLTVLRGKPSTSCSRFCNSFRSCHSGHF